MTSFPLKFTGSLAVGRMDQCLLAWTNRGNDWRHPLTIDLSGITWLDAPSLIYLAAIICGRTDSGLRTQLRIPSSKRVRDFLRLWRFQVGLREVTGLPLSYLVHPDDLQFFGEDQTTYKSTGGGNPTGQLIMELSSRRFFGLMGHRVEGNSQDKNIIRRKWNHWRGHLIMRVLDTLLGSQKSKDVSRVIVYEAMANSLQHPAASIMASVSKVDSVLLGDSLCSSPRKLTMSFWDNGEAIADTLMSCVNAGLPIRAQITEGLLFERVVVKHEKKNGEIVFEELGMDWTPSPESDASKVLVASMFPGITRKASINVPDVASVSEFETANYSSVAPGPGMGLYALLRTVVDELKGEVSVRTGSYFLNVKRNRENGTPECAVPYKAKVQHFPDELPPFLGNMITIRIPLRS